MATITVNMNGFTLQAPPDWTFAPVEKSLMAKRDTQKGVFRIYAPQTVGAEDDLLALASRYLGRSDLPKPFDLKKPAPGATVFGGASYHLKDGKRHFLTRVWYLRRESKIICAAYACPWKHRGDDLVQEELHQCERMLLTVQSH